jgi:hypothetical protein
MKRTKKALLELVVISGALLTAGCIPGHPLTPEDQAQRVYKDMQSINNVAQRYISKNGDLPADSAGGTRALLFTNATKTFFSTKFPTPPPEIFSTKPMDYQLTPQYDRMDAGKIHDTAIAVWGLKDSVCREYNRRFASDKSGPIIYDYEANGKRYPGESIGRQMITYAIKWKTADIDDCEINWVVEYR